MTKITRRRALGGLAAIAAEFYLETRGIGVFTGLRRLLRTNQETDPKTIDKREYSRILKKIKQSGYGVDTEKSQFVLDSESLIVFLPDIHSEYYAKDQRLRLTALDRAIDFDVIGLEGMVGEVDVRSVRDLVKKKDDYFEKNVLSPVGDFKIDDSDNDHVRLQKLGRSLQRFMRDIDSRHPTIAEDYEAHSIDFKNADDSGSKDLRNISLTSHESERYDSIFQLDMALGHLNVLMPARLSISFEDISPVGRYMLLKEFSESKPRANAPGLLYFDIGARAKKVGMETASVDEKAVDSLNAYMTHMGISEIEYNLKKSCDIFEKVKKYYDGLGTEEEQKAYKEMESRFNEYVSFFRYYLEGMRDTRDQLLARISEEKRKNILERKYDPEKIRQDSLFVLDPLIIDKRSEEWVKNLSNQRVVMLVGGASHTDSVYQSAKDQNCSIISLREFF